MRLLSRTVAVIAMLFVTSPGAVSMQAFAQMVSPGTHGQEVAATLAKATAVRDAFVARIHADGFSCPIPVPTILVEDVPSFGQYDDKTNVIRTSDWTLLNPRERAFFFRLDTTFVRTSPPRFRMPRTIVLSLPPVPVTLRAFTPLCMLRASPPMKVSSAST